MVVMAIASSAPADACTGPTCSATPLFFPAAGRSVPANTPALLVTADVGLVDVDDAGVELTLVDGGPVPAAVAKLSSGFLIRPQQLEAGTVYELRSSTLCWREEVRDGGVYTSRFTASEMKPLPSTAGTLAHFRTHVADTFVGSSSGSCGELQRSVIAELDFKPSADLEPYLPVASFILEVDGAAQKSFRVGELQPGRVGRFTVHSTCDRNLEYADEGLAPGRRTATVVANLLGSTQSWRSDSVELTLDCAATDEGESGCGCTSIHPLPSAVLIALTAGWLRRRRHSGCSTETGCRELVLLQVELKIPSDSSGLNEDRAQPADFTPESHLYLQKD